MIVFDKLWETMKRKGFTTYRLRVKHNFDYNKLRRLRKNQNVTTETLNEICTLLNCKLSDIAEFVPDEKTNENETST